MRDSDDSLNELLIQDVPVRFVTGLIQKLPVVYKEAYGRAYEDPAWNEPEAHYILGHYRRILFEPMFRREAAKAGLRVRVELNAANNCHYTLIHAGRFILTESHVRNKQDVPKRAIFRQQHALINKLLMSPLLPFPEFDSLRLSEAEEVYGVITHGSEEDPTVPSFFRVAFLSADDLSCVANICLFELHQAMLERARAIPQRETTEDRAHPRLKRQQKKKKRENE